MQSREEGSNGEQGDQGTYQEPGGKDTPAMHEPRSTGPCSNGLLTSGGLPADGITKVIGPLTLGMVFILCPIFIEPPPGNAAIGCRKLLELLFRQFPLSGRTLLKVVRMPLFRHSTVRRLDLLSRSSAVQPQKAIVAFTGSFRSKCHVPQHSQDGLNEVTSRRS